MGTHRQHSNHQEAVQALLRNYLFADLEMEIVRQSKVGNIADAILHFTEINVNMMRLNGTTKKQLQIKSLLRLLVLVSRMSKLWVFNIFKSSKMASRVASAALLPGADSEVRGLLEDKIKERADSADSINKVKPYL
jgi:hypothetical protein